jgi:DNA-binding FadR family transcriptional regulator
LPPLTLFEHAVTDLATAITPLPVSAAAWASALDDDLRRQGKLAPHIAKTIEAEVFRLGWPVGHPLGKEEELAARFGVSRTILREALAITERDGVTLRQRGRSGGVAVAAPAQVSVSMALGNYLVAASLSEQAFGEGYALLQALMFQYAMQRCTAAQAQRARELAARPLPDDLDGIWQRVVELHDAVLAMTGNRAIQIFSGAVVFSGMVRFYTGLAKGRSAALAFARATAASSAQQIECVIAGDVAGAVLIDRQQIGQWREYYQPNDARELDTAQATRIISSINAIFQAERPLKRADVVALQLQYAIAAGRYGDGDRLDSEATLLQRYQASRGVLREAIRSLERYAVVRMEEGRHGGLRVAKPDPAAVVRSAVLYFRFLGLQAEDFDEFGVELTLAQVGAAARNVVERGPQVINVLTRALDADVQPATAVDIQRHLEQIYAGIAAASGNALFVLLVQILTAFLTIADHDEADAPMPDLAGYRQYLLQMREVEQALRRGDGVFAQRCLLLTRYEDLRVSPHRRELRQMLDRIY